MAVLVTRPAPDNAKTAEALAARGFEALLSPTLRFEPMPFYDDHGADYDGVILTSANGVRALRDHEFNSRLVDLPSFAVGEHTAETARQAGFTNIIASKGDAGVLRDVIAKSAKSKIIKKGATLCYIAGADLARDLAAELGQLGFTIITHTAYRMMPVVTLSSDVIEAVQAGRVEAVLHFSRRSARAFVAAAGAGGVEVSALALPQYCISDAVGMILRDAGATKVVVAPAPNEADVIDALANGLKKV